MCVTTDLDWVLAEQLRYYGKRGATDFDRWMRNYMANVWEETLTLLRDAPLTGRVLDLAAGTGIWTRILVQRADHVTAMDGSPEMVAKLTSLDLAACTPALQNLFHWRPTERWDNIFWAHWLTHVPDSLLPAFWGAVRDALQPGGSVVYLDVTAAEQASETRLWTEAGVDYADRETDDHEQFAIVKHYRDPSAVLAKLETWGWHGNAVPIGDDKGRGIVLFTLQRA